MITSDQVIEAIKGSKGIVKTISNRLGCDRTYIYKLLEKYPEAKDYFESERESRRDYSGWSIPKGEIDKGERYIYLVRESFEGLVKIGIASDVEKRLANLQSSCPQEIELIGMFKTRGAQAVESHLHHRFADKHFRGEWFALTDDDISLIMNYNQGLYLIGLPNREGRKIQEYINAIPGASDTAQLELFKE